MGLLRWIGLADLPRELLSLDRGAFTDELTSFVSTHYVIGANKGFSDGWISNPGIEVDDQDAVCLSPPKAGMTPSPTAEVRRIAPARWQLRSWLPVSLGRLPQAWPRNLNTKFFCLTDGHIVNLNPPWVVQRFADPCDLISLKSLARTMEPANVTSNNTNAITKNSFHLCYLLFLSVWYLSHSVASSRTMLWRPPPA